MTLPHLFILQYDCTTSRPFSRPQGVLQVASQQDACDNQDTNWHAIMCIISQHEQVTNCWAGHHQEMLGLGDVKLTITVFKRIKEHDSLKN